MFFLLTKIVPEIWFYNFSQIFLSELLICSFIMSNLSKSLTVAQLSWVALFTWATWVIHSQSLITPEQSERIAHSRSFDLSDQSEWGNEQWANERIPSPTFIRFCKHKNVWHHSFAEIFSLQNVGCILLHQTLIYNTTERIRKNFEKQRNFIFLLYACTVHLQCTVYIYYKNSFHQAKSDFLLTKRGTTIS